MRLIVYNIRYATGTGPTFHLPVPGSGYLRSSPRALHGIAEFIRGQDPDIVGLVEVDTGSIRSGMINQAEFIAHSIGHYSIHECKYGVRSFNQRIPVLRKQSNAFLSAPRVHGERFHYFTTGIKRLIIELELSEVCVFLVHLSLKYRQRQEQLRFMHDLIQKSSKPVVVAGDFNTFWGTDEIYLFMRATGLRSANAQGLPSYPARVPRAELDFVLVDPRIRVEHFAIPDVRWSDHRPLVCEFSVIPGGSP